MFRIKVVSFLLVAILLISCSAVAESADYGPEFVAGSYTCGDIKLELLADGTFTMLSKGMTYAGTFSNEYTLNNWTHQYSDKVTITSGTEDLLNTVFPWYWTCTLNLTVQNETFTGNFSPNNDMEMAGVDAEYSVVKDDASPTGYMVTFSVPDESYQSVLIRGCWLAFNKKLTNENDPTSYDSASYSPFEWENGMYYNGSSMYPMTLENGQWIFSVPLASSTMIYRCYHDIVDEEELARTELNGRNGKTAYIPYDAEKQSESMDWSSAFPVDGKAGNLDFGATCTSSDGHEIKMAVYTPYDYSAENDTQYPVVYLVPGGGGNYQTWFLAFHAKDIFDNLIANGKTSPTIVVSLERADAISYLFTDIIPAVEEMYHVDSERQNRALVGASMGSVFSTECWLDPDVSETFAYYGFFSGASKSEFEKDFEEMDEKVLASLKKAKIIIVGGCLGDFNTFDGDSNSASILRVHDWMNHYAIEHRYEVVGGGHDATTWATLLIDFAENILWK